MQTFPVIFWHLAYYEQYQLKSSLLQNNKFFVGEFGNAQVFTAFNDKNA